MTDSLLFNALLIFFVIAPIFDGIVVLLLYRAWLQERVGALTERVIAAASIFASTVLISFISLNRMFDLHVPNDLAVLILLIALVLISVPSLNWLRMFVWKKF